MMNTLFWSMFNERQWHCTRCHGLRVRLASHERGDAGKGYVTKDYGVKPEERMST